MKDPYQVLGVKRDATQEEIGKAFHGKAKKYHPDLHPGDKTAEERFKEVTAAHQLLSDPEKRAQFDRGEIDASGAARRGRRFYRSAAGGMEGGQGQWPFGDAEYPGFNAEDLFGGLRGRRGKVHMRGADVSYGLTVTFLEAAKGATRRLSFPDGNTIDVAVPEGTRDRQTLRLKGKGGPGVGGAPAGDAFIEIHVEPHPFFRRTDNTIDVEVPVTPAEAALGAKITVPTIHGKVSLTVPKGSNSGTTLRLKDKGVRDPRGGTRGDQHVTLRIVLPDRPDAELTAFLERWAAQHDYGKELRAKAGMA